MLDVLLPVRDESLYSPVGLFLDPIKLLPGSAAPQLSPGKGEKSRARYHPTYLSARLAHYLPAITILPVANEPCLVNIPTQNVGRSTLLVVSQTGYVT